MSIKNVANIGSTTESTLSNLQSLPLMTIQGLENTSASAIFNITEGTFKFYSTYNTSSSTFNLAKLQGKSFKLQELEINGQKTVGFSAPDAVDATYSITMPPEVPVVGGVMVVNSFDSQTGEAISEWKIPSFLSTTSTPLPYSFASFDPNLEVVSIGPLANNQLFTGVTGNFPQIVTLTNTANITYTNGSGVLSFNTVQDINAAASPTFTGVTLTGIAPNQVLTTDGSSVVTGTATLSADKGGLATNASAFTGVVKANAGTFSASALVNADVASGANIDAAKIGTGVVSTTEFNYLDGVTSSIQTQLNTNATGLSDHLADAVDAHDASAISNIPAGNIAATDVQAAINELDAEKQPIDATLTALAAYNTNGFVVQTAADTFAGRSIAAGTGISVSNDNGVAGNPTITNTDLGSTAVSTHVGLADPHTQYLLESDAATTYQPLDSDLTAVAVLATTGIIARTGAGTAATRTITAGSSKVSVTAGDGVTGNPTIDVSEANLSLNNISGTLSETKGGTAQTSYATGDILYASGANTLSKLPIGSATQVLTVSGGVPTWGPAGTTTIGTIDSQTKSANGLVISSGAIVAQTADASFPGMVSTVAQTIAGSKTFSSNVVAQGGVSANAGFGLESATSGALNVGTTGNTTAVNIGTAATTQTINIGTGAGTTTINLGASGDTVNIAGTLTYVNTTNLEVTDKRITVNKGGTGGSEAGSGVEVEDNGSVTSYYQVNGTRTGWSLKAPTTAGVLDLVPGSNATTITASGGSITLPNVTGTVITSADTGSVTSTMIANNTIMDGDINASAAIAHSKLANITAGSVLLGNASNVPTATALSGDVTVNSSGVTAIGTGVIVDSDISASAAIARTKLASGTADHVIINNGSGVFSSEAQLSTSRGGTGVNSTATFPTSGVVVTEAGTQTLTNKTAATPYITTGADLENLGAPPANPSAGRIRLYTESGVLKTRDSAGTVTTFGAGLTSLNGLTAGTQTFATGTSGTDFNISSSTSTHTFNIPDASATNRGVVTTGAQTFAGTKTFSSTISGSITGNAGTVTNGVYNGGNTLGAALTIGTNDAFGLNLETNGTTKLSIDTTGGLTASSATTHIFGNSSGAATTGIRIDAAANQDRDIILRSAGVTHFGLRVNTSNACYLLSNSQTINFSGDAGTTIHGSMTSAGAWTLGPSNGNGTSGGASALPHRINGFTDNRGITAGTGPGGGTATCNFDAPFVQGAMYRVVVSVVDNTTPTNWTTRTFDFIENVSNGFGAMNTVNATNGIGTLISSLPISRSGGTLTLTVNVACTNTATIKLNLVRYV